MNNPQRLIGVIVVCCAFFLTACSEAQSVKENQQTAEVSKSEETNISPFTNVAPPQWKMLLEKEAGLILDVRTPQEVNAGKIPQSIAIDFFAEGFQEELKNLDLTKPVYVYCASGGRSGKAMKMMQAMGFQKVYNLEGGFGAWQQLSYPQE